MSDQRQYSSAFFNSLELGSLTSARHIVPLLLDALRPASVVDVGCGSGAWLAAFSEAGVSDVIGVDGEWVEASKLLIPASRFVAHDLRLPLWLDRRFDLALCLEVAEHLPESAAGTLVGSLVKLADAVLFSAAVPGQGGVAHINEQWPAYWIRLFEEHGFRPADVIRSRVWENAEVEWWYAQNALLYVDAERPPPTLADFTRRAIPPLPLIHPRMLAAHEQALRDRTLRELTKQLPTAMKHAVVWRVRGARAAARKFRSGLSDSSRQKPL